MEEELIFLVRNYLFSRRGKFKKNGNRDTVRNTCCLQIENEFHIKKRFVGRPDKLDIVNTPGLYQNKNSPYPD